jgi:ABC-type transport system involved in multi-copper enzyme maturation permease subunit
MLSGSLPLALVVETPPLNTSDWFFYVQTYLQDAGAIALLGLWIWLAFSFARAVVPSVGGPRRGVPVLILGIAVLALALYATGGISAMVAYYGQVRNLPAQISPGIASVLFDDATRGKWYNQVMDAGGFLALLGVFLPFFIDCTKLRWRRIWALTRLTFLEAVRRRVLWGFLVILIVFLFPPKWFLLIKPEDEIRVNVNLVHAGANLVLLLAAAALASFSIPTDIRNQTIHTIVTKPVEKFEIVLGRFLGYLGLTTTVLIGVFGFALLMLASSRVEPEAREESMKARDPIYGDLDFRGRNASFQGESVGREWEYRRYVPGGFANPYRAMWVFLDIPSRLLSREWVACEFDFDIFRTTKGEENKAVECTFFVFTYQAMDETGAPKPEVASEYQKRIQGLSPKASPTGNESERRDWQALEKIAADLGYYEYRNKPIADYHTDSISIPKAIFTKASEGKPGTMNHPRLGTAPMPRVVVSVRCDSNTQFLGVAKYDLYLLAKEGNFYLNFFKGGLGIWMRLCLVIGIAVACSTYLNGVISFLVTAMLVLLGFFKSTVMMMVMMLASDVPNPGPFDSVRKLVSNESLGMTPDAANPTFQVASAADEVFRWAMRRVISTIPDMERLTWRDYVADGFAVPNEDLVWNFFGVIAYLSIWAVLGHYLIKWREVATW